MSKLWIVIKEIYRKNVKSWAFFWMTFGPILMTLVIGVVVYFIIQSETDNSFGKVAIVSEDNAVTQIVQKVEDKNDYVFDLDEAAARKALTNKEIVGYLKLEGSNPITAKFYKQNTGNNIDLIKVKDALQNYQMTELSTKMGLNQEQIAQINDSTVNIETLNISLDKDGKTTETSETDPKMMMRTGIAYVSVFIIFLFIMNFSSIISQEIATEKGSRLMEIILSSISASTHFYGKMLGISLVILTQFVIYGLIYFIVKIVFDQSDLMNAMGLEGLNIGAMLSGSENVLLLSLIFALLGIVSYAALSGFLGSLVENVQDVNKTITPIMLTAVAGLYIGMFAMQSPNNLLVKIGSFVPLISPLIMPFRIASLTVSNTEIIISIIISLVFSILSLVVASMFYKSNVLTTSDKGVINTMKQSFSLWKSEKKAQQQ